LLDASCNEAGGAFLARKTLEGAEFECSTGAGGPDAESASLGEFSTDPNSVAAPAVAVFVSRVARYGPAENDSFTCC
jgi:hypothetical protein